MAIQEAIEAALFQRAASLQALTGLPISWPNMPFSPPQVDGVDANGKAIKVAGPYLRVEHIPNRSDRLFINSAVHQRQGLLQITIVTPQNRQAVIATRIADQVSAHFPMDLKLPAGSFMLRITKAPDIAPAMKDDPSWVVPVTVSYEAFA